MEPRLQIVIVLAVALLAPRPASAAEHITLANGFEMNAVRHELLPGTNTVRLFPESPANAPTSYIDLPASSIRLIEPLPDPPAIAATPAAPEPAPPSDLHALLTQAGARHNLDVDLLASVVNAESGGHPNAVSRTGARGLMQLMPATAAALGVQDAFRPDQNIAGGVTYLDRLLTRYHDDLNLALAAYNAGPGAVDRYHGVPPFRETHAYIARIVNEFNRRKRLALQAAGEPALKAAVQTSVAR